MKNLLLAITALALLTACSSTEKRVAGPAIITGQIAGEPVSAHLNGAPPLLSDGWSNPVNSNDIPIDVGPDGTFDISVALEEPAFYRLTAGDRSVELFLQPGDRSQVTFGEAEVEFSGDGAERNRSLQRMADALDGAIGQIKQDAVEIFSADLNGYQERMSGLGENLLAAHAALLESQESVPAAFVERTRDDIIYTLKDYDLNYPRVHHELTGERADIPEGYIDEVARGGLDRTASLSSRYYLFFLDAYVRMKSRGERALIRHDLPQEKLLSRYDAIAGLESTPEIKNYLLDEMFRNFRISYGPRDWGRVLEKLESDEPGHAVAAKYRPHYEEEMGEREAVDEILNYKVSDGIELEAHVFYPDGYSGSDQRSAYLFFHGGGWAIGTPEWGYANCQRMADRGMVAVSFEYRLADVHGTDMFAGIADVQDAVRWARSGNLGIDPNRVVAAGFSAGGHLAAGSAIFDMIESRDPSPRPNALVIHSSSYNLTKSRFFEAMTGGREQAVSLTHQVQSGLVPAILFHGAHDHLAPLSEFEEFVARMEELGNDFEFHLFQVGHFFRNDEARRQVHELTDDFLVRRGFLAPR